jgi:peptidoglycan hydrolase FlgJ
MSQIPSLALPTAAQAALAADPRKAAAIAKSRASAEDFEAVFLNTMMQQMMGDAGQGPFSGGAAANTWRSFLVDEYAKTFAKAGGIGIADHVQRALLAQQEIR